MKTMKTDPAHRSIRAPDSIGVGIDTARYGHQVTFLRDDRQPATAPLLVLENPQGYQQLRQTLETLQSKYPQANFRVHIDAAGQYATNLERFLRSLPLPLTISVGEPKRNKDYHKAIFPKRTADATESHAMARFAVAEQPPPAAAASDEMYLLREIAGRLQAATKDTTRAVNRLHNLLARVFPELATHVSDLTARWVLALLKKHPTAEQIASARLGSLQKLPYANAEVVTKLHAAAKTTVGSLRGEIAAALRPAWQPRKSWKNCWPKPTRPSPVRDMCRWKRFLASAR